MAYHITFRQLEIFAAVSKHLSYTVAAEKLHLSQPAVSMQVKQLENLIGEKVTEKIGKKLFLTDMGKVMMQYADTILSSREAMEETISYLKGSEKGHLNLAVPETANQFVTLLLAQFRKLHPGITFTLQIQNRHGLLNCIKENTTDLVIMGQTPDEMDLVSEAFMKNPLVIIAPSDRKNNKNTQHFSQLTDEEFVVREPGSGTRIAMRRFFDSNNLQFKTSMEMPNNEAIKQAVAAGLGLGIVSLHTLQQELKLNQVEVLNIEEMPIMRIWYIVHHQQKILSPAMEIFKRFVIEETEKIWIKKYPELKPHLES